MQQTSVCARRQAHMSAVRPCLESFKSGEADAKVGVESSSRLTTYVYHSLYVYIYMYIYVYIYRYI